MIDFNQPVSELIEAIRTNAAAAQDLAQKFEPFSDQQLIDAFKALNGHVPMADGPWV
jgi:hypothetical protein